LLDRLPRLAVRFQAAERVFSVARAIIAIAAGEAKAATIRRTDSANVMAFLSVLLAEAML
jgi:hypothetical protein